MKYEWNENKNLMKKNYNLKDLKARPGKVKVDKEASRVMISLKVDANDLSAIKTEALRLGMPYQTLINSLIHRYINRELIDKRDLEILKLG